MKETGCDCDCILVGRKFLKEDGSVDVTRLAVIFERWHREQLSIGIKERHAFTIINGYSQNLCKCECHQMKTIKKEK